MRTPHAIFKGRLGVALTGAVALLLAGTGVVVGGGAAQAQGSGFINVMAGVQEAVSGNGWADDTAVAVSVDGNPVGTAQVQNGMFFLALGTAPAVGETVVGTGLDSGHSRTVMVPDLRTTQFDVPDGQVHGFGAPASTGWSDVRVNLGNQWTGSPPAYAVVGESTGTWTADVGAPAFDLRSGFLGSSASQTDTDGDFFTFGTPVPIPVVDVWDSHGVALHGWQPGSTVTITLAAPGNGSFSWDVAVDADGEYWDVPPESPWDIVLPGWTASATGPVAMRETATVTKSIVVPDPFPFPEMAGFQISDTVPGTLTSTTIGAGSIVNVSPTCPDLSTPWREAETDGSGYFAMNFAQDPPQDHGMGTCSEAPLAFGYDVRDLDGDNFSANWQVAPDPSVTADSPLWDGQQFEVAGTGFDLMMVELQQCELVGDQVGRCDPSTAMLVNPYPGTEGSDWPLHGARFEEYGYTAKQVLDLGGGASLDCADEPESCAVLVTEPQREGVSAYAPLTFNRVVDLELTASGKGTVSTVTGAATLTGTVAASEPTWVHLSGTLVQRFGRTRVVRGDFDTWMYVEVADVPTPWSIRVDAYTGQAFGSGFAEVTVTADLGDDGPSWAQTTQTVKLSAPKAGRR